MLLGVNQSSGGFLRMISDHDLSLWTKNKRRLTIANNGLVGIGIIDPQAKLHVGSGDIIAQTQTRIFGNIGLQEARLSFYNGDNRLGGVLSRGENIILENENKGVISLRSNETDHLIVRSDGNIRISGLKGNGDRKVLVDAYGNLKAAEEEEDVHMLIPVTQFQAMFGLTINSFFDGIWTPPSFFHQNLSGMRMTPVFHHTRVFVKELTVFFIDNDNEDISFQVSIPDTETIVKTSSGINGSVTFELDVEIDQSDGESVHLFVLGAESEDLMVRGAKIIYQKL